MNSRELPTVGAVLSLLSGGTAALLALLGKEEAAWIVTILAVGFVILAVVVWIVQEERR